MKRILTFVVTFAILGALSFNTMAGGPQTKQGCVVSVNATEVVIQDLNEGDVYIAPKAQVNLSIGDNVTFVGIITPSGKYIAIKVIKDSPN